MNKRKFFIQGLSLTAISLILRSANLWYRSFLTERMGAEGLGLYQLIFSVFTLAITLTTSGISLAVTRLVTSALNKNERGKVKSLVNKCLGFCLTVSLVVAAVLWCFSGSLAGSFLKNPQAAPALRLLAVGLPFISASTCLKGYFLAVEEGVTGSVADLLEEALTIALTVVIFNVGYLHSLEMACAGAMLAASAGEVISFLWNFIAYRRSIARNTPGHREKSAGVIGGLLHIALPCTLSAAARSLLSTAENLLIPLRLQAGGFDYSSAMSVYGILHGMALPMLYFPSSLLFSFAFLMIPKLNTEYELRNRNHVAYMSGKAIFTSLSFGVICGLMFYAFSGELGLVFYKSSEVGRYIRYLAPLCPLIFLDVVMDSLLKALDQQVNSMKYNIMDSALRVALVMLLLKSFGISSYIGIMYFSCIFNVTLSLRKLVQTSGLNVRHGWTLLYELPAAVIAVIVASKIELPQIHLSLFVKLITAMVIYGSITLIFDKGAQKVPEPKPRDNWI